MPSAYPGHVAQHTGLRPLPPRCLLREVAQRNSPLLHIALAAPAAAACKVLVAVAQHDSPEFRRQSQEYVLVSTSRSWDPPGWEEGLRCCVTAAVLLLWKTTAARGGCSSLRSSDSRCYGGLGPSHQCLSLHRPCVQPAGPSPCWILLVWITLTLLRSCLRTATSSLR